ncbi:hypothetical protein NVP1185O_48 [Vibrio phage 1.185.O._10N.286.49.C2]|nr:hypothetical protein NVP1185O_48 [Vibrio phage 1.185.O._10N.286.49.C2]
MSIEKLADQLRIDEHSLLALITKLNDKHDIGIEDTSKLTPTQHNTIRSLLDPDFLVKFMIGDVPESNRYNYSRSPGYQQLERWIAENNLNGYSTKEVKAAMTQDTKFFGPQTIAAAMKANGYSIRVVVLDNGKQGRRWYNDELWQQDTPSFF